MRIIKGVTKVLVYEFVPQINWPEEEYECRKIAQRFSKIAGVPNVIGTVDGTHVDIIAPKKSLCEYKDKNSNKSLKVFNLTYDVVFKKIGRL